MLWIYLGYLALLGVERLVEMTISKRNAAWALARGGVERGQRHFKVMTLLHSSFFVGCVAEVLLLPRPFVPALGYPMLTLALVAQGLRYWAVSTLGRRWNVRVIVVPGAAPVSHGPYRFIRHPNYLAVILEGVAVPLIHTAWITALTFSLLNAALLRVRIRCEEQTLSELGDYQDALGGRRRFLPTPGATSRH